MYDWETRLTSVDSNRVVRPLEWGLDWSGGWPCRNGSHPAEGSAEAEKYLRDFNQRVVKFNDKANDKSNDESSDEFFSYVTPSDFRIEDRRVEVFSTREIPDPKLEAKVRGTHGNFLRFTSPVKTPFPENNLANARWFPAKGHRAVVLLPHWNSDAIAYNSLCRVLNSLALQCCD